MSLSSTTTAVTPATTISSQSGAVPTAFGGVQQVAMGVVAGLVGIGIL
jgi:hypothetical protein